ncbi:MAG: 50S ribosomal protein L23 [Candidatus Aenigmarchaeota archaeon]|nr:50S ribosomal protein L23 [Candidatus Aenigmarchaeota archaeon]
MKEKKPKTKEKPVKDVKEKPKVKEKLPKKPVAEEAYDPWKTLLHPHLAEKAMTMVELQNKLTFIVNKKATKGEIAEAVEKGFHVEVQKVNVEVTMKGLKKAYVTLGPKHSAADIATRLGMI